MLARTNRMIPMVGRGIKGLGAPAGYSVTPSGPVGFGLHACGMLYPQLLPSGQYDMDPAHTVANTMWTSYCYGNPNATDAQKLAYAQSLYAMSDAAIMAQSAAAQASISAPGLPPGSAQFATTVVTTVNGKTTTSSIPATNPLLGGNTNPLTGKPYNVATMGPTGVSDPQAYGVPVSSPTLIKPVADTTKSTTGSNTQAPNPPAAGTTPMMQQNGSDGTSPPTDTGTGSWFSSETGLITLAAIAGVAVLYMMHRR